MTILREGLKEGDLQDLVLPMVSIDEYESKLDDDSIVVAFYVADRDPANDLNRFIQKGAADVLDTDVSPAPNPEGYYLVFVELMRDEGFLDKLHTMIDEIRNLTLLTTWHAKVFEVEKMIPLDSKDLLKKVRLVPLPKEDDVEESISEFFRNSNLDEFLIENNYLKLRRGGNIIRAILVDYDRLSEVAEHNAVMNGPVSLDEAASNIRRRFQSVLGEHWCVEQLGRYALLSRDDSDFVALLRL
jgi:hypothetical protein